MAMPAQSPGRSKQDYATPTAFLDAVKRRLGIQQFAFDFAASRANAQAPCWYDQRMNALAPHHDWLAQIGAGWGWLNPPFSKIEPWVQRCQGLWADGGKIALLVPASVGSNWYRDWVHGYAQVLFLNGRLAFIPEQPTWLYPKDCMCCLYGPECRPGCEVWTWKDSQ